MRRLALLALPFLLSGCSLGGGNDGASIKKAELKELVLQPGDLPPVFARFDEGRQLRVDQPAGSRRDPRRFGREDGWKARYTRPGAAGTAGPLVVESRVDLFHSAKGAGDDLEAQKSDLGAGPMWRSLQPPALADGAIALTLFQPGAGPGVRSYLVAWREDNLTASVLANGFEGKFTLAQALGLARRQQAHLARALSGTGAGRTKG